MHNKGPIFGVKCRFEVKKFQAAWRKVVGAWRGFSNVDAQYVAHLTMHNLLQRYTSKFTRFFLPITFFFYLT
jgi:hypothetical protein